MTHDLVSRLVPLEQEINRLEHYVALLEPRQAEVIRLAYFEGHTWQQISAKTQITTRTLCSPSLTLKGPFEAGIL